MRSNPIERREGLWPLASGKVWFGARKSHQLVLPSIHPRATIILTMLEVMLDTRLELEATGLPGVVGIKPEITPIKKTIYLGILGLVLAVFLWFWVCFGLGWLVLKGVMFVDSNR